MKNYGPYYVFEQHACFKCPRICKTNNGVYFMQSTYVGSSECFSIFLIELTANLNFFTVSYKDHGYFIHSFRF